MQDTLLVGAFVLANKRGVVDFPWVVWYFPMF
jgi:hypothetical protein